MQIRRSGSVLRATLAGSLAVFAALGGYAAWKSNVPFDAAAASILDTFTQAARVEEEAIEVPLETPSAPYVQYRSDTSITMGFTDNANAETGFVVENFRSGDYPCRFPNVADNTFTPRIFPPSTNAAPRQVAVNLVNLDPARTYNLCVRAVATGKASPYAPILSTYTLAAASTAKPRLEGKVEYGVKGKDVTIRWQTNVPTSTKVRFGLSSDVKTHAETPEFDVPPQARVTLHQVEIKGLAAGKTYYYAVSGIDENGNEYKGAHQSLQVKDKELPALTSKTKAPTGNTYKAQYVQAPPPIVSRYGLDPLKDDFDGDGYYDVEEILNNYDPKSKSLQKAYAFGLPRVKDLNEELAARKQLEGFLFSAFEKNNIDYYVKAMVYGKYPLADAVQLAHSNTITNRPYGL